MACVLCEAVAAGENHPRFLRDYGHSVLLAGEHQFFPGYCVLVAKDHIRDFHEMSTEDALDFVRTVLEISHRLDRGIQPRRLNHAMLGNVVEHVHWHLFPRPHGEFDPTAHPWAHSQAFSEYPTTAEHVGALRSFFANQS